MVQLQAHPCSWCSLLSAVRHVFLVGSLFVLPVCAHVCLRVSNPPAAINQHTCNSSPHQSSLQTSPDCSVRYYAINIMTELIFTSAYLCVTLCTCAQVHFFLVLSACSPYPASCQPASRPTAQLSSAFCLPHYTLIPAQPSTPPSPQLLNKTAFELL